MQLKDLHDGMKRVNVTAQIVGIGEERQIHSRFNDAIYRIVDAVLQDTTGAMKLCLWNDQIDAVHVGDNVIIEGAYVTSFKQELQINVGKFGKLTVADKKIPEGQQ